MKTYKVSTMCKNCGYKARYEIEFGKTLGWAICNNCGCSTLEYDEKEYKTSIKQECNKSKKCK